MKNIETFNQLANGDLDLEDLIPSIRAAFPHENSLIKPEEKHLLTSEIESEGLSKCSDEEGSESRFASKANKVH